MLRSLCLLLVLALAFAGAAIAQETLRVEARDDVFVPEELTIARGDTVAWTNTGRNFHTVTSGEDCTASGIFNAELPPGEEFSHTFESVGEYPYFCVPHCAMGMVGTITVRE
jgi:plastocyanin